MRHCENGPRGPTNSKVGAARQCQQEKCRGQSGWPQRTGVSQGPVEMRQQPTLRTVLEHFACALERAMGIEPTTYSLGSCRSTTELRPQRLQNSEARACRKAGHCLRRGSASRV